MAPHALFVRIGFPFPIISVIVGAAKDACAHPDVPLGFFKHLDKGLRWYHALISWPAYDSDVTTTTLTTRIDHP